MRHAQLKAFHAVAVHGGFSRAAEALGLTQPAVSDHVRKLEESYGVQLFTRGPAGVALTDMGRKLFAIAERQFEAESEALEVPAGATREFTVALSSPSAAYRNLRVFGGDLPGMLQ